ncbi:MAG TPA: AMP-binding protein, partial [Myxococcota bacterium]|nr:AMP-binding protein [Myxococcota bacterium]
MLTIPAAIARAGREFGDHEAIATGDQRMTYAELHEAVRTIARRFAALGLSPGDRLAFWAPNIFSWVPTALAAL